MGSAVAIRISRAPTLKDLDDLEGRVRRWFLVFRDGDLAGTTTVRCRSDEAKLLRCANRHVVHFREVVDAWTLLARVV